MVVYSSPFWVLILVGLFSVGFVTTLLLSLISYRLDSPP